VHATKPAIVPVALIAAVFAIRRFTRFAVYAAQNCRV
jgi:hypothetical protein